VNTTFVCNTFHNPWVLRDCLVTLADNAAPTAVVVVAQDASADERRIIDRVCDFIDLPVTLLFAGNVHPPAGFNEAVEHVKTEFVALFNDDVMFPSCPLWEPLEGSASLSGVGMVGAATNCAATAESILNTGRDDVFETEFLTGGGHFMRTALYRELGGYDQRFTALGGYWDIDLCMRVRQAGLKLLVDRRAYYHHSGSQTIVQTPNRALLGEEAVNALVKKHGVGECRAWLDHAFCDPSDFRTLKEAVA